MYFLFVKVMDVDYKEDIFLALESAEIIKASYVKGINLDNALTSELPLFRGFFQSDEEKEKKVIIVTALLEEKNQAKEFVMMLKESGLDVDSGEIVRVLVWPAEQIVG